MSEISTVRAVLRVCVNRTKYALLAVFGAIERINVGSISKIRQILDFIWASVSGAFFFAI